MKSAVAEKNAKNNIAAILFLCMALLIFGALSNMIKRDFAIHSQQIPFWAALVAAATLFLNIASSLIMGRFFSAPHLGGALAGRLASGADPYRPAFAGGGLVYLGGLKKEPQKLRPS